jgi:hypothetical protein
MRYQWDNSVSLLRFEPWIHQMCTEVLLTLLKISVSAFLEKNNFSLADHLTRHLFCHAEHVTLTWCLQNTSSCKCESFSCVYSWGCNVSDQLHMLVAFTAKQKCPLYPLNMSLVRIKINVQWAEGYFGSHIKRTFFIMTILDQRMSLSETIHCTECTKRSPVDGWWHSQLYLLLYFFPLPSGIRHTSQSACCYWRLWRGYHYWRSFEQNDYVTGGRGLVKYSGGELWEINRDVVWVNHGDSCCGLGIAKYRANTWPLLFTLLTSTGFILFICVVFW